MLVPLFLLTPVALAGFEVSSSRHDSKGGASTWGAGVALDSNLATCWQIDPEQENAGSWIALDVPPSTVDKIAIVVGWDKNEDTFTDYARVKEARIEVLDGNAGNAVVVDTKVSFEDKRGWQIVDIPDGKVGGEVKGGRIRMTVLEVYPGHDFPNLALSELRIHLKEFPAETGKVATAPESSEAGHDSALLMDGKDTTFWASEAGSEDPLFEVAAKGYGLASIGIRPGPAPYDRPKTVELTANDAVLTVTMEDKAVMQWFTLPAIVGYTGGAWGNVKVKIVDTYGTGAKGVAVGEVKLNAATIEEF